MLPNALTYFSFEDYLVIAQKYCLNSTKPIAISKTNNFANNVVFIKRKYLLWKEFNFK